MPFDKSRYPENWKELSLAKREAAGWQCEQMVEPFEYLPGMVMRCYRRHGAMDTGKRGQTYKVVLTVAHLDHNPQNNDPENLRALCQEHHLAHDHDLHIQHAKETRERKRAMHQKNLFELGIERNV